MPEEDEQQGGNPAWQDILSVVPEEFHGMLTPKLQEWDTTVNQKFQEIHSQYDPYKPIVENKIPVEVLEQSLAFVQQLEQNPAEVIKQAIEHFELKDLITPQPSTNPTPQPNEDDFEFDEDAQTMSLEQLKNDPQFKAFFDKQAELEQYVNETKAEREAREAQEQLEGFLGSLHEEHGEFDDLYVASMLANGYEPDVAVKQYQDTIQAAAQALLEVQGGQQQQQQQQPPVVAGANGTSGSGVPTEKVELGKMPSSQINDLVGQMIQKMNSEQ